MGQSTLDQGRELFAVAGKTTGNVSRAEGNWQLGHVDGRNVIDLSSLDDRTDIGRGGEVPPGSSVDAIIFYNVSDIHVAPHQLAKVAPGNRRGLALAGAAA